MGILNDESNRDRFDDPRRPGERLADTMSELRQQLQRGEIPPEEYEARVTELVDEEHDAQRAMELEPELPPGEIEEIDESPA